MPSNFRKYILALLTLPFLGVMATLLLVDVDGGSGEASAQDTTTGCWSQCLLPKQERPTTTYEA